MDEVLCMKSGVLLVSKVLKKTSSEFFSTLKEGSKIEMSIRVKAVGSNRGKTYSPSIKVLDVETGNKTFKSFNEIEKLLACFEFMPVAG